ncbi:MAG: Aspartate carbamoyltransferase [Pseudomonadota bacterium]|jgi:aspartate carbamoyltransferase catalytic subunit
MLNNLHPQLYNKNLLKHLLSIEGLPKQIIWRILKLATNYLDNNLPSLNTLYGFTVSNLFFENSTRTRSTFELAAQKLGAHVLSLNIATSSTAKGESLLDTVNNICAMQTNLLVMRHAESGAPFSLVNHIPSNVHIINAGDGQHEHPTQALLDMCTILKHKCLSENIEDFANLRVAIVGDILHSRVARSNIFALSILGCTDIRLISPKTLLPKNVEHLGVTVYNDMKEGLKDVDVVIMLRLQNERMQSGFIPNKQDYFNEYGLDNHKLTYAKPDAIVMHPGPINRGVEIATEVADGKQSLILNQVKYGIAVRMAVMQTLIQDQNNYENSN